MCSAGYYFSDVIVLFLLISHSIETLGDILIPFCFIPVSSHDMVAACVCWIFKLDPEYSWCRRLTVHVKSKTSNGLTHCIIPMCGHLCKQVKGFTKFFPKAITTVNSNTHRLSSLSTGLFTRVKIL